MRYCCSVTPQFRFIETSSSKFVREGQGVWAGRLIGQICVGSSIFSPNNLRLLQWSLRRIFMGAYNTFEYEGDGEETFITPKLDRIPRRSWVKLGKESESPDISVFTNNILAPRYMSQENYPFTREEYLSGSYRFGKLMQHLHNFQSVDVFCCQEVQLDVIELSKPIFEKEGYDFTYKQVTKFQAWNYQPNDRSYWKEHKEGVAIFFKKEVFDLLNVYEFEFNVEAFHEIINAQVDQEVMKRLLYTNSLSSHNVGIGCRFRHKKSGSIFLICTTHAYFNFQNWVSQTYQLENFFRKISDVKDPYDGLIILGDFNASPDSPTMEFVANGSVKDFGKRSGELMEDDSYNIFKMLEREPSHTISGLTQCYPSHLKPVTKQCHRAQKRKVLDYIWKNGKIEVDSVLGIPEDEFKDDFPNSRIPSDHVLLGAKLRFVRGEVSKGCGMDKEEEGEEGEEQGEEGEV